MIVDASVAGAGTITLGGGRYGVSLRLDADGLIAAVAAEVAVVT